MPPYFRLSKSASLIGMSLILLFCLFPFWAGDYYHSIDSFNTIKKGGYSAFEDVYIWIINNIAFSYTFFRLLVWGTGLSLLFYAYKRIGLSFDLSLFFFGTLYLPLYSYARASLAMSMIVLGLSFLYKPINLSKVFSFIIGLAFIGCSLFFHRSALVGIFAAVSTLLLIDNKKWKILAIIIVFPIGVYYLSQFVNAFVMYDFDSVDEMINRKKDLYLNSDIIVSGISARINNFLTRTPMLLSVLLYVMLVINGKYRKMSVVERGLASYVFIIMLVSMGFMLNSDYNTNVLYYRTINYAMPPNAVFLMSIRSRNYHKGLFRVIYWMALFASLYSLLYSTYMGYNRM